MKRFHFAGNLCACALLAASISCHVSASPRLIQTEPSYLDAPFTIMTFDENAKGQLYAVAYGYEQAYVSSDNGEKWRLAIDFHNYYDGTQIVNSIRKIKPGKNPDVLYILPRSNTPEGEGLFSVNHKTGEIKHYKMPDTGYYDTWIAAFDVYDKEGKIVLVDANYRIDMTTIYSIVYITTDGGENWTPVYRQYESDFVYPGDVAFCPNNPSKLYIFRGNGPAGVNGGVLISEDSGKTWRETLPGHSLGTYAFNPSNPDEIYVGTVTYAAHEAVFRTSDGGDTWEEIELPYTPFILNYIIDIAYDRLDPNNIFILEEDQIFSSSNGFADFTNVAPDGYMWGTGVSINPFNSDDVVIGVDMNGVMRSDTRMQTHTMHSSFKSDAYCSDIATNGTSTYFLRNGKCRKLGSYASTEENYTSLYADAAAPNSVFAYNDENKALAWINFGDQPTTTQIGIVAEQPATIVYTGQSGKYLAVIGGKLYNLDMTGATPSMKANAETSNVISAAADGNSIYIVANDRIKKSIDGGAHWSNIATLPDNGKALSVSAGGGGVLAITESALYTLANSTWNKISDLNSLPIYSHIYGNTIVIRETRPNNLVAMRYSKDGGATWNKISERDLEYCHAQNVAFIPDEPGVNIYLASSDMGLLTYCADDEPTVTPDPVLPGETDVRMLTAEITSNGACDLSWVSPQGHYSATYNVYRDHIKIADGINCREFSDKNIPAGKHTWRVSVIYNGVETDGSEISATYTATKSPVNDADVSIDNLVNGDAIANLSWILPDSYDKCFYNIYRDGELIAEKISSTTYTDRNLTGGRHNWSIAAVYNSEESTRVDVSADVVNNCSPIRNLDGYFDLDERVVALDWDVPGDLPKGWLTRSGEPAGAYGPVALNRYDIVVAHRYSAEELENLGLVGSSVYDLTFVPMSSRARYFARVWIGTNEEGQPADEYIVGNLNGIDSSIGDWNLIKSNTTIEIPEGKDLWIGIGVQYAGTESPLGIDNEPLIKECNYIRDWFNQPFAFFEDYTRGQGIVGDLRGNFCIGVRLKGKDGAMKSVARAGTKQDVTYEVLRDGKILTTTTDTHFSEGDLEERIYNYSIRALHENKGIAPEVSIDIFAGNKCPMPSNATLAEEDKNVKIAWEISAPQLVPTILFDEKFDGEDIPEGWKLVDNDGDNQNWVIQHYPDDPNGFLFSDMYYWGEDGSYKILSPDNWIISPQIDITGVNAKLVFYVSAGGVYQNQSYYEVLISTTGTNPEDFTPLIGETLDLTSMIWLKKVVDLSAYHGKVYIALRHRNNSNENCMGLYFDNVTITHEVEKNRVYNVYRDGMPIAEAVEGTSFTDSNCPSGEHTWVITSVCDEYECESDPLSITANVTGAGIENVNEQQTAVYYDRRHRTIVFYGEFGSDTIHIYDVAGKCIDSIAKEPEGKTSIFAGKYADGVYIAKCGKSSIKVLID